MAVEEQDDMFVAPQSVLPVESLESPLDDDAGSRTSAQTSSTLACRENSSSAIGHIWPVGSWASDSCRPNSATINASRDLPRGASGSTNHVGGPGFGSSGCERGLPPPGHAGSNGNASHNPPHANVHDKQKADTYAPLEPGNPVANSQPSIYLAPGVASSSSKPIEDVTYMYGHGMPQLDGWNGPSPNTWNFITSPLHDQVFDQSLRDATPYHNFGGSTDVHNDPWYSGFSYGNLLDIPEEDGSLHLLPEFQQTQCALRHEVVPSIGSRSLDSYFTLDKPLEDPDMPSSPSGPSGVTEANTDQLSNVGDTMMSRCRVCKIDFPDAFHYTRHLRTHDRTYRCTHRGCQKVFAFHNQLQRHLRNHSRPHHCLHPHCSQTFAYKKDLTRHVRTRHSNERPYLCPVALCKFALVGFKRKDNLKRHLRCAHPQVDVSRLQ